MQAEVGRELGVEGRHEDGALAAEHGMAVDAAVAYLRSKKRDVFFTGMNFRECLNAFHERVNV